jgi:hypothetical protein
MPILQSSLQKLIFDEHSFYTFVTYKKNNTSFYKKLRTIFDYLEQYQISVPEERSCNYMYY